jgi:MFS family permease
VFAALLVPTALSLLTTTFTDPRERNTASGIYGAIAGAGGAVGLLLGGSLTRVVLDRNRHHDHHGPARCLQPAVGHLTSPASG